MGDEMIICTFYISFTKNPIDLSRLAFQWFQSETMSIFHIIFHKKLEKSIPLLYRSAQFVLALGYDPILW